MKVEERFNLASPEKEKALREVVAWVFENEEPEQIAASLLSRDAIARGEKPRELTEAECQEGDLLYLVAFNFEDAFNQANSVENECDLHED